MSESNWQRMAGVNGVAECKKDGAVPSDWQQFIEPKRMEDGDDVEDKDITERKERIQLARAVAGKPQIEKDPGNRQHSKQC